MNVLYLAVNTNDLPKYKVLTEKTLPFWCHIVELAFDSKYLQDARILKIPNNVSIAETAEDFHRISKERCEWAAHSFADFENFLLPLLASVDLIVTHNNEFDINALKAEFMRLGCDEGVKLLTNTPKFCTMEGTRDICKLPNSNNTGYKVPKLTELYKFLFSEEIKQPTRSSDKVQIIKECFEKLVADGYIEQPGLISSDTTEN